MNRDSVRPIVLALLCVVAIGLAASTLNSTVQTPDSGGTGIGGTDDGVGIGQENDSSLGVGDQNGSFGFSGSIDLGLCYPFLSRPVVITAILAAFAIGAFVAYRRVGIFGSVAVFAGLGLPVLFVHVLLTSCGGPPRNDIQFSLPNGTRFPSGGSGGLGSGSTVAPSAPSVLVTILLGITLLTAVVLLLRSTEGDSFEEDETDEDDSVPDAQVAALGRAAGEAADRIEAAGDLENEVYRAWREMTTHLDVARPESSTPAEFAAAAVAAGMDSGDVSELTTLFEEVRYGDRPADEEREERALSALRRIEDQYARGDEE